MPETRPATPEVSVAPDPLAGTPYRTVKPLGKGGMGEVVEALHVELDRSVVVKLLHGQFASEPKLVDRLRVEARTLAALAHPHIVSVSDFGRTPGGRPYFVMERLQGLTLRQELEKRGPLPVGEALEYVRQVLSALSAAHRLGIIHRDVKTDNVFLCTQDDGRRFVKLLDFGIAKILGGSERQHGPVPLYPTEEGILLGTPRTLAPEQAQCLPVDARTDIYAAGILLYTLVVGHGPYPHARDQHQLITAHVMVQPTPPSQVASQAIPLELDQAILKALAKAPDDRFQTAEQFSAELGRVAASLDAPPPPVPEAASSMQAGAPPPSTSGSADDDASTILDRRRPSRGTATPGVARARLFVGVTVASAAFFCAVFAVILRYFGGP